MNEPTIHYPPWPTTVDLGLYADWPQDVQKAFDAHVAEITEGRLDYLAANGALVRSITFYEGHLETDEFLRDEDGRNTGLMQTVQYACK